ncbi:MAG: glycosyltransferase [Thermodesulfovibrionales bacterium]|nr:glycosyltransferase [Thermodesulfovibrionales bacterium]
MTWAKIAPLRYGSRIDQNDFLKWIRKNDIEIVFFNEQSWWYPVLWCREWGVKTGAYVDYYTEETVPFFEVYDFLICNTKRHFSVFDWHPQAFYVPWGTDTNIFKTGSLSAAEDGFVTFFLSTGYDAARKGCDLLLKAFSQLRGSAKLVIHAQSSLRKSLPHLDGLISDLEKNKRLTVIEKTVAAPGLYHLGDVYVYASKLDGIGLSVPEALASGLPAIVSDNPPMNEFVTSANGRLIPVTRLYSRADGYYWPQCSVDPDSLREHMQYYVDNAERITEFKKAARAYAEKHLDWEKNGAALKDIFATVKKMGPLKEESIGRILDFEVKHGGWRLKLYLKHPVLSKVLYRNVKLAQAVLRRARSGK